MGARGAGRARTSMCVLASLPPAKARSATARWYCSHAAAVAPMRCSTEPRRAVVSASPEERASARR